jgi:tripartite-type tricarboxylate transporter receptor subunit TctC
MPHHSNKRSVSRRAWLAAAALSSLLPLSALAQDHYPDHPVTLVVPFGPGGIADVTARAVAQSMTQSLGQTVVVDNRPSAGSIVASQMVASARPDGYTLLLMSNGNAVSEGLFKKLPYDTMKDLTPVSTLGFFDLGVFVGNDSRFSTLQDLLQYAKVHPDALKVGTIAVGSTQHLASQLFQSKAGIDMLDVPYRGSPAVLLALRRGEIDVALEILGPMLPQVKTGAVRVLALTGDRPNPALPSAPTVQQAGTPGYSVSSWNAIAVPAGTPPALVARLNEAAQKALASPEVRAKLEPLGVRMQGSTPAQAHALVASEIRRWAEVIRAAKIEPQ